MKDGVRGRLKFGKSLCCKGSERGFENSPKLEGADMTMGELQTVEA